MLHVPIKNTQPQLKGVSFPSSISWDFLTGIVLNTLKTKLIPAEKNFTFRNEKKTLPKSTVTGFLAMDMYRDMLWYMRKLNTSCETSLMSGFVPNSYVC